MIELVLMIELPGFKWERLAAEIKHGKDVGPERPVPLRCADIANAFKTSLMRRIVNQDIKAAQVANRLLHESSAMRFFLNISGDQYGALTGLLDPVSRLLSVLMLVEVADQDVSSLAREGNRHGPPDPQSLRP